MTKIDYLHEVETTRHPSPYEEQKMVMITYRVEGLPPRTMWIPKEELPDLMYLEEHPRESEAPEAEVTRGDWKRFQYVWEDLARIRTRKSRASTI